MHKIARDSKHNTPKDTVMNRKLGETKAKNMPVPYLFSRDSYISGKGLIACQPEVKA